MKKLPLLCTLLLLVTTPLALAAQRLIDLSADGARIYRGTAPLTAPSSQSRAQVVRDFLVARGRGPSAQSLHVVSEQTESGLTHLRMEQQVSGLTVYGTYVRATADAQGRLISVIENSVEPTALVPARVSPGEALAAAIGFHYADRPDLLTGFTVTEQRGNSTLFANNPFWYQGPVVTRVAVPLVSGPLREGFLVETWEGPTNTLWHTVVDDQGQVVHAELRSNTDTYMIFPDHPGNSTQTVVNGPGSGNAQSPLGWVTTDRTIGNNVDAYLDRNNDNAADTNGRPISVTQNFESMADLTVEPTTTTNQMAGVTNLFYLNNVIHDKLYRHGFNEAAGNFQTNNFGLGGSGNDPVNAEAQDGGGTNNANFATPADGSRPRMQMYLWNRTTPQRDGDLDSDIVWHEYGHGLTWRMIGGMSGALAGAIGEGMSDTLSIYINRDDRVGEYSYNSSTGIRRFRYTDYPNTYSDVTGSSVHNDGEIYAATMWKLLSLWEGAGYTQDELFDHVVSAMNFTPSRPAYEDMRDGILAAVPTQAQDCVVWTAFAQFGIGEGANGTESCNFFRCSVSITESFAVPSVCSGGPAPNTAPTVTITAPANGSSFLAGTAVTFSGTATDTEDGNVAAGMSWTSSLDGAIGSGSSFTTSSLSVGTHTVTAAVTDSGGLSDTDSISVTITSTTPSSITLTASGRKVKGVQNADLSWTGATSSQVDVFRNNVLITTTANDGSHTDNIGAKGGGSYTYRVCEAGTATCSNDATINF